MKSGIPGGLLLCILTAYLILSPNLLQASEPEFLVSKINITGNTVISSKDLYPIVKNYEGKLLTLSELQKLAVLVTEEYKKQGYLLAKAYIPEQKVINCEVEIAVLEGKVGDIIVQGDHKYYSTNFIRKHFAPLIKEQALNQDTLERAILVLNEYPRLSVKTMLQAGKEPGTTDIIVKAENSLPIYFTLDYNNFGTRYTGMSRYGATLDVGNLIREGSLLSLRGVTGDDPDDILYGRISYAVPINVIGTKVGVYYAKGDFDVGREFAILEMTGRTESYGIYVTHPFIKKRNMSLTGELDFDVKNTKQFMLGTMSSDDKIRSIRGGVSFECTDITGRTATSLFITQGLGDILGAMENDYEYSSRYGADNRFTKINLDIVRLQKVLPYMFFILKGSGQWASDSLVATEQFYIGGADSVRGYPEGEYLGDHGYSATAEMRISPISAQKDLVQLAFFIDTGGIIVKNPVVGQDSHHALTGGGAGIRLNLPYDIDIRADVGFPLSPDESSEGNDAMLYLQAVKRF